MDRKPDFGLFIGILCGIASLFFFVLQANGVEVNWGWSLAIYLACTVGAVWTTLTHALPGRGKIRWMVAVVLGLICVVLGSIGTVKQYKKEHQIPPAPAEPLTALAMQCSLQLLPIVIPPGGEAPLMFLHHNPEFNTQLNNTDHLMKWPLPSQAIVPRDEVKMGWKCIVESLNQSVEDVSIPMTIAAGDTQSTTSLQFALLAQNQPASLFIVNQCPITTTILLPDTATLKLLGDPAARSVPLHGSDGPIGKLMLFGPSKSKWSNEPDCEWEHK